MQIVLDNEEITVDGQPIGSDSAQAVYAARDIVYYPSGQDFTFGEGTQQDAHESAEANGHTVVHIARPGTYVLTGKLSAGQIAVDLGADAKTNPNAVVTLILNDAEISCTVAPAVIFYNVYECGDRNKPSAVVDTTGAGANIWIADGTENHIAGSYVAEIYDPDTVEPEEDGTEVDDAETLHKYDGAFYSKMSMNIGGIDGVLNIRGENEGLDSEMHLTINGGIIRIESGNDGINTNEDEVSVTTINGGDLTVTVTGESGEGDGIDSNGWLVINGGTVRAFACSHSADAGLDADLGVIYNGGTIIAAGSMADEIHADNQIYTAFSFSEKQSGGGTYTLRDEGGETVFSAAPVNDFTCLLLAGEKLVPGDYSFYHGELQLEGIAGMDGFGPGMMMPEPPEMPDRSKNPPEDAPDRPDFQQEPPRNPMDSPAPDLQGDASAVFTIQKGANHFHRVSQAPSEL